MLFTVIVFDADERGGYLTIILMRQYRKAQARFGKPGGSHLFSFSSARKRMSVLVVNKGESTSSSKHSFRFLSFCSGFVF